MSGEGGSFFMAELHGRTNPLEYQILRMMEEAKEPLGAGALGEMLRECDITISEAGVGRALRDFRHQGFLLRMGFQGHVITESGRTRLRELEDARAFGENLELLLQSGPMQGHTIADILIARRALEREAAYQAALNATDEDIKRLEDIIRAQYEGMEKNENYANLSTAFHREVMVIADAPILKSLYELIGLSVQWQDFFIGTFKMYNQPLNVSHEKILAAIKEHDANKASSLMGEHLTDVINNAKKLCFKQNKA